MRELVGRYGPKIAAYTGKGVYLAAAGRAQAPWGLQADRLFGSVGDFVLPRIVAQACSHCSGLSSPAGPSLTYRTPQGIAIERDRQRRVDEKLLADLQALFAALTPREREVLTLVAAGLMNKQIAAEIGIAEITVKIHRGSIMRKMGAKSLADLVKTAEALGVRRDKP